VSSNKQTAECQKPEVAALLQRLGLTATITYEEQASAAKHRPEFERMLQAAKAGKFKVLVIWAIDRFGRTMAGNIRDLLALDEAGVRVISAKEPWLDSGGPVRELLIAIFSWVAQQERARLIERTNAGIAHAKASGKRWGNLSPTLLPKALQGQAIALWEAEGKPDGFAGLAAQLGCRSTATSHRLYREWVSARR
jgi:DNA invertase Pin-like site-specific DNA recombinase